MLVLIYKNNLDHLLIYDLSGKELPQSNSSLHGIMIVKQGKITRKIIR